MSQADARQIYHYLDGTPTEPLTADEAIKAGFCPGCGWFVAGVERDDIALHNFGICDECLDELRSEMGEYGWGDDD